MWGRLGSKEAEGWEAYTMGEKQRYLAAVRSWMLLFAYFVLKIFVMHILIYCHFFLQKLDNIMHLVFLTYQSIVETPSNHLV